MKANDALTVHATTGINLVRKRAICNYAHIIDLKWKVDDPFCFVLFCF